MVKAKNCFNTAIISDASNPDPISALGKIYLWLGDIKEADNQFKKVCSLKYSNETIFSGYIKTFLSDKKLLSALIKHEYEQLTHLKDNTSNIEFEKEYYNELERLYSKIRIGEFCTEDVDYSIKTKIAQILSDPLKEKPEIEIRTLSGPE